jgi:4-carboxymuconolactone decarboxylase
MRARAGEAPTANIFATLVRHPGLFRRWLPFGGKLLSGKLPARDRELLSLRTGWLCQFEATLLLAADELHSDARISDATWDALASRYDERQMIEIPMLIGHYHMVAFALNSLGVQLEQGVTGFDPR